MIELLFIILTFGIFGRIAIPGGYKEEIEAKLHGSKKALKRRKIRKVISGISALGIIALVGLGDLGEGKIFSREIAARIAIAGPLFICVILAFLWTFWSDDELVKLAKREEKTNSSTF